MSSFLSSKIPEETLSLSPPHQSDEVLDIGSKKSKTCNKLYSARVLLG